MNWLDLVILIMLAAFAYAGYQRGIIKSVLSVAILLLSLVAALIVSPILYEGIISNEDLMDSLTAQIEERLRITEYLEKNIELGGTVKIKDTIDGQDIGIGNTVKIKDISDEQIEKIMEVMEKQLHLPMTKSVRKSVKKQIKAMDPSNIESQIVYQVSDIIGRSIAQMIIKGLCFTLIYALMVCGLGAVAKMLNLISHLPVIHSVNKIAGAGLGLVEGVFVFWIVGTLAFTLVNAFAWQGAGEVIKGSLLMSIL